MFRRILFHGPRLAAGVDGAQARPFSADGWMLAPDEVGVVLADAGLERDLGRPPRPGLGEGADRIGAVQVGELSVALDPFWDARLFVALPREAGEAHVRRAAGSLFRVLEDRARQARDRRSLAARTSEIQALVEVGIALAAETDRGRLLETILSRARALTASDAGSLYLVAGDGGDEGPVLHFAGAQNDSVRATWEGAAEAPLPIDAASIAGFVARSGEVVNVADVRALPPDSPFRFDPAFDDRHGYRTRSVLAAPMRTPDGRITGVLQLINRKRRVIPDGAVTAFIRTEIVPFDAGNAEIARSLAAQAAVAVENRRLAESIQNLLEGFVEASVTAIEQRDPTTSGHSHRVARLTCRLAEAAGREDRGPYADFRPGPDELRELRYAAILHDFGKVGVREEVLVKARKLSPVAFALARSRFEQAALSAAAEAWRRAAQGGLPASAVESELVQRRGALARSWSVVERSNAPTVLARDVEEGLRELRGLTYRDASDAAVPLVTEEDLACLAIPLGSLTPSERREIESHVTQTFRFLDKIPWTRDLARVPDWAFAHHEKLDGSGYPRGLSGEGIPAPVRMMTICDIYDALAARDRPYKAALPADRALEILEAEARRGVLDGELLRIFVAAKVWEKGGPSS